jgi:hypothetical protein
MTKHLVPKLLFAIAIMIGCKQPVEQLVAVGGHKFLPVTTNDSSFPYFPLKDKMPKRDSFNNSFYAPAFLSVFEEPNISLRPATSPVYRFIFQCQTSPAYIVNITEDAIIIKEGKQVSYLTAINTLSNPKDDSLLGIFKSKYPIKMNDSSLNDNARRNLDSLISIYPELLSKSYYDSLIHEAYLPLAKPFKYKAERKPIKHEEFIELQNLFIRHGYWSMPFNIRCENPPNDGCTFSLEANNVSNYNIVKAGNCNDQPTGFDSICHAIINAAGLTGKILIKSGQK